MMTNAAKIVSRSGSPAGARKCPMMASVSRSALALCPPSGLLAQGQDRRFHMRAALDLRQIAAASRDKGGPGRGRRAGRAFAGAWLLPFTMVIATAISGRVSQRRTASGDLREHHPDGRTVPRISGSLYAIAKRPPFIVQGEQQCQQLPA